MPEKSFHFICPHFLWMPNAMKADETFNPIHVDLFGPGTIAGGAHRFADPVEQFWGFCGIEVGQTRIWHLAVFLDGPASKGQEIDGKLQSNSS